MDQDEKKYRARCETNRINGEKGGRPPKTEKNQWVSEKPKDNNKNADGTFKNGTYNMKAEITASSLNIRAGRPGNAGYKTIYGQYKKGEVVTVKYCLNNWFGVIYKGKQAFICGSYIKLY
jgi:hypothetical protein